MINIKACLVNTSSQRSMQKKKTKKKKNLNLKANTIDFAHGLDELRTLYLAAESQGPRGTWFVRTCHWQRQDPCIIAEAVGVFLFGVYIQTHPRLMHLYICTHIQGTLLFLCGN